MRPAEGEEGEGDGIMAYFTRANLRDSSRSVHFADTKTGLFDKSTLTRTALPTPYFDIGWGAEQEGSAVAGGAL